MTNNTDHLNDGLRLFQDAEYWQAHEAWEKLWLSLPHPTAARRATKSLIQLAAICYKPDQAASGRDATSMQQGMHKLLVTSRTHLADSQTLDAPSPTWSRCELKAALENVEKILASWQNGRSLDQIRAAIAELAADFDPTADQP